MFTKVSICLFLLRITITPAFIRPLQAAIAILIVSNVVLSLVWILQCTPHLDKAWNDKVSGKCFSKGQLERIIISQARQSPFPPIPRTLSILSSTDNNKTSHIHPLRLLPLRLPHPHPPQSPNLLPLQTRSLRPHGPRRHNRLPLHRPHGPKLAERNLRPYLG